MSDTRLQTATAPWRWFKAIAQEQGDANQAFNVCTWRGLIWLERALVVGEIDRALSEVRLRLEEVFLAEYGLVYEHDGGCGSDGV